MISTAILKHFGISEKGRYESALFKAYKTEINTLCKEGQLSAVIGGFGAGKTTLATAATDELTIVSVRNPDKERLRISHIINAAIYQLSEESPKRDAEARAMQFANILYNLKFREKKQVVIIVENAHRLHANTILALKDLREITYAGRSGFFSILLVGQDGLRAKIETRKEVSMRTNFIMLNEAEGWMDFTDRVNYLKHVYGPALTDEMRHAIAFTEYAPLSIDHLVDTKLKAAWREGRKPTIADFNLPTRELYEKAGITYATIAQKTGLPPSTAADAVNKQGHRHEALVRSAINDFFIERSKVA